MKRNLIYIYIYIYIYIIHSPPPPVIDAVDDFEDDLDVFNAFGEFDDLDPMAANSSDGGDDSPRSSSDGSNTEHRDRLTDIPRYDGKDKQRNGAAKISCSMPIPMNNNWGGRVPQKDIEVVSRELIYYRKYGRLEGKNM